MSKKRTYTSRIADICQKAKHETIALMEKMGRREVELQPGSVYIISENEAGVLTAYSVKSVSLNDYGLGTVLEFDTDSPGHWYNNSTLWGEIYDAVRRILCGVK